MKCFTEIGPHVFEKSEKQTHTERQTDVAATPAPLFSRLRCSLLDAFGTSVAFEMVPHRRHDQGRTGLATTTVVSSPVRPWTTSGAASDRPPATTRARAERVRERRVCQDGRHRHRRSDVGSGGYDCAACCPSARLRLRSRDCEWPLCTNEQTRRAFRYTTRLPIVVRWCVGSP